MRMICGTVTSGFLSLSLTLRQMLLVILSWLLSLPSPPAASTGKNGMVCSINATSFIDSANRLICRHHVGGPARRSHVLSTSLRKSRVGLLQLSIIKMRSDTRTYKMISLRSFEPLVKPGTTRPIVQSRKYKTRLGSALGELDTASDQTKLD